MSYRLPKSVCSILLLLGCSTRLTGRSAPASEVGDIQFRSASIASGDSAKIDKEAITPLFGTDGVEILTLEVKIAPTLAAERRLGDALMSQELAHDDLIVTYQTRSGEQTATAAAVGLAGNSEWFLRGCARTAPGGCAAGRRLFAIVQDDTAFKVAFGVPADTTYRVTMKSVPIFSGP